MKPLEILKKYFGFNSFRLKQESIITNVLEKKDTLVLMPTGGGKSLCYQIPALIFDGLTLVVSPLIALMKDQVDALQLNGIEAAFLNSTQSPAEQEQILQRTRDGKLKLLYLAPEKLMSGDQYSSFLDSVKRSQVSLIAIDEAHCISHWGHDFRPEYLTLSRLKKVFPNVPVIALTATADKLTRKDIIDKLALDSPAVFISSFNRANIRYTVEPKRDSFDKLLLFLKGRRDQSGIIYCLSRRSTESLVENLQLEGFSALAYHAGMDREQRSRHQDMFLRDDVRIMVATIAFGMGIDKSNVRFVVHMDLPKNIESYYQETGRAGRDGLESEAVLYFSPGDVMKLKKFAQIENNLEQTKILLQKLDEMGRYGDLQTCRRKYLLNYFDEPAPEYCDNCDVCLSRVEEYDATESVIPIFQLVRALHEKFGGGYVCDILFGSSAARIQADHKALPYFGIGREQGKKYWMDMIHELTAKNYFFKTGGIYPVLKLGEKAHYVLDGKARVMLTRSKEKVDPRKNKNTLPHESDLLRRLKTLRRELATTSNVPAYIVLSDASLLEIATYLPHTVDELRRITGFGDVKIQKYGISFCACVAEYCHARGLSTRIELKAPKPIRKERIERDSETKQFSLRLFEEGNSITKIAEVRKLSPSTIEGHLAFYVQQGRLSVYQLIDIHKLETIRHAIETVGGDQLTSIKLALGDDYTFSEIRYVLAHIESNKLSEPMVEYGIWNDDEDHDYVMEAEVRYLGGWVPRFPGKEETMNVAQ
jgi:ATP-dependent DNA helicase RecQ